MTVHFKNLEKAMNGPKGDPTFVKYPYIYSPSIFVCMCVSMIIHANRVHTHDYLYTCLRRVPENIED